MRVQNFRRVLKLSVSLLSPKYSQGDCCREWFGARDRMVVWDTLELLQRTLHKFLWPCKSFCFVSLFHGHEWKGYAENFSRRKIPKNAFSPSDPQSLGTQWSVVLRILEQGMGSVHHFYPQQIFILTPQVTSSLPSLRPGAKGQRNHHLPLHTLPGAGDGSKGGRGLTPKATWGGSREEGDGQSNYSISWLWLWVQDSMHLSKLKNSYTKKSDFYYMQIN